MKGGGHATNLKFLSTSGVQIALSCFNEIKVNGASGTVEVGAGLTWDQVYAALKLAGLNIVGGRTPGVVVAGLTLGGGENLDCRRPGTDIILGYSFHSSQYGLSLDNVARFELVLSNGTIINVTSKNKDLWFALRVSENSSIKDGVINAL